MRIVGIVEQTVPVASSIRNAVIDFSQMTATVVAVITDIVRDGKPMIGYGFNSNGRYAQGEILRERVIPRLLKPPMAALLEDGGGNFDPFKAWQVMMTNEKPGGHGERSAAVGAVDMALWDLVAKIEGKPLCQLLAERYNQGRIDVNVRAYAAGGYYYPGGSLASLKDELRLYLDRGYESVKIKIGGVTLDEDIRRIEAALEVVGEGKCLAVDANARFGLEEAVRFGDAIAQYGLKWYEEPCDPLDYVALAEVAQVSTTPIATGENLFSLSDGRNLIRHGGLKPDRDILQMDPTLSYGLVEYLRILQMLDAQGWARRQCIPHGGHRFGLHIAAGLGLGGSESYPDVFAPFGDFGDQVHIDHGVVRAPEAPGIGFELKSNLMAVFKPLVEGYA
jgi:L-alanine-DL-glutamate epimerase-like enolase superfamily enzyme